jgi:hypothetical protein
MEFSEVGSIQEGLASYIGPAFNGAWSILWTFGFEDLALLAFAPDGFQKGSTLLRSGNLVDSSPVL